jgi:hypothetical protein
VFSQTVMRKVESVFNKQANKAIVFRLALGTSTRFGL